MKRIILAVLVLGLLVSTAFAGDYTVTISPLQEQGLKYVVDKHNTTIVQPTPQKDEQGNGIPITPIPPVTKAQYLKQMIKSVLDDYVKQGIIDETSVIGQKYQNATDAQKAQIKTLLGVQ